MREQNKSVNSIVEKSQAKTTKQGLISSFIKMGVTAALIALPALAVAHSLTTSNYQEEMRQVIQASQQNGYLGSKIKVDVKEKPTSIRQHQSVEQNHADVLNTNSCDVTITLSKAGDRVSLAHDKSIKKYNNEIQKKLSREFLLLHEASHCEFKTINDVFIIKGNPQLQKEVNYYFKHTHGSLMSDSPYLILNENFADTYAAIQLIKLYGDTTEVISVITQAYLERRNFSSAMTSKLDSHFTHASLSELLIKENIEAIKSTSDVTQLRQLSLEISNKGTFIILSTHADALPTLFEQFSMIQSTLLNANNNSIINFYAAQNFDNHVDVNNESFFQQLGREVLKRFPLHRKLDNNKYISELSQEELNKLQDIAKEVFSEAYENEFEKIDNVATLFKKYIIENYQPLLERKIDTTVHHKPEEPKDVITQKIRSIRGNNISIKSVYKN